MNEGRPHFLESSVYDTTRIVGFGKPYRGIIDSGENPLVGESLHGILDDRVPLYTSTVRRVQPLGQVGDKVLYLIETRNSVYVVKTHVRTGRVAA